METEKPLRLRLNEQYDDLSLSYQIDERVTYKTKVAIPILTSTRWRRVGIYEGDQVWEPTTLVNAVLKEKYLDNKNIILVNKKQTGQDVKYLFRLPSAMHGSQAEADAIRTSKWPKNDFLHVRVRPRLNLKELIEID